jgi:hypothetical protein
LLILKSHFVAACAHLSGSILALVQHSSLCSSIQLYTYSNYITVLQITIEKQTLSPWFLILEPFTQRLFHTFNSQTHWIRNTYMLTFVPNSAGFLIYSALSQIIGTVLVTNLRARQTLAMSSHFQTDLLCLISLQSWLFLSVLLRIALWDADFHFSPFSFY